ncbi:hypothetical protein pdam_00014436 [Pocillopora damicornis]|uniref:J domain-containing protein n=1 Tax=Pocillopora damicornis TaxID=46731 RepID=A0A3M6U792_POCDA|nr:hypothetical protein pdam_00014436 [Pocillopora damicornis]
MGLSKSEAYSVLELPLGASYEEIRSSYKRLALKWHPDKHNNSQEATKKFQEVSSAYKRLTSEDSDDEINLTPVSTIPAFMTAELRCKCRPAHNLSEAEAMKNAKELIEEEERDRKKAEKRRAKKKRNKERKKEKEREKKAKDEKENIQQQKNNKKENIPTTTKAPPKEPIKGNEMANVGNYQAAVDLFTQAINLDAKDFRFFGNRSYCYDRMGQYEKALQDADVAISLAPDWPKGYFRRGRALAGLKLYSDAESSFAQVLKLDKHCEDAMFELARVRVQQLEEMGFPQSQSEAAIQAYGTVQAALEALLAGKVSSPVSTEIYVSDGEDDAQKQQIRMVENGSVDDGPGRSLWVGNVNPEEVSERHLVQLFSRLNLPP